MSSSLPEGLTRRPLTREDAATVAALFDDVFRGARPRLEAGDVLDWRLRADLAHDSWLFETSGRPVAVGWFQEHDGMGFSSGCVHPVAKGQGIGTHLVGLAEARAGDKSSRALRQLASGSDGAARALFESRSYRDRRHYFEMAIDLDEEPAEPELPAGFSIESGRRRGGEVSLIGVRKPWRRRGLGLALLHHSFREFRRRGLARASLGVDMENPTGALGLYERAGMHVAAEYVSFERRLVR